MKISTEIKIIFKNAGAKKYNNWISKRVQVDSNRQKKESVNSKTGHFKLSNLRNKKKKIKEKQIGPNVLIEHY